MDAITVDPAAMADEAAMQIAAYARQKIMLVGQLSSAMKRIKELEAQLAEKKKSGSK